MHRRHSEHWTLVVVDVVRRTFTSYNSLAHREDSVNDVIVSFDSPTVSHSVLTSLLQWVIQYCEIILGRGNALGLSKSPPADLRLFHVRFANVRMNENTMSRFGANNALYRWTLDSRTAWTVGCGCLRTSSLLFKDTVRPAC